MLFLVILVFSNLNIILSDVDVGRDIKELILSRGFDFEDYKVETPDKYVLTLYRIINPYVARKNLRTVFLQHGIIASASNYLENAEGFMNSSGIYTENGGTIVNSCDIYQNKTIGRTLGFVLSACGYDVWLGNNRGTTYSKVNKEIKTKSKRFWEFSFQEMAFYDIPASISFVLSKTNSTSLAYIGHSQGTTQMFALLSAQPEFSEKINLYVAMAPVVYLGNTSQIFRTLAKKLTDKVRKFPFPFGFSPNKLEDSIVEAKCTGRDNFCAVLHSPNINQTRAGVYVSEFDVTSTRCIVHFGQIINYRNFVYFDYGSKEKNYLHYGTKELPIFNISAITSKRIALFYGDNDIIVNVSDVELLKQQLKVPLLDDYKVPFEGWTHADFLVSKYTGYLINPKILSLLNQTSGAIV